MRMSGFELERHLYERVEQEHAVYGVTWRRMYAEALEDWLAKRARERSAGATPQPERSEEI